MDALFLQSGKIAPQATKNGGPFRGTKTPRNLLSEFHHAKIIFRLIVIKRDYKIMHETQDLLLIQAQAMQEIANVPLRESTTLALISRSRSLISLAQGC